MKPSARRPGHEGARPSEAARRPRRQSPTACPAHGSSHCRAHVSAPLPGRLSTEPRSAFGSDGEPEPHVPEALGLWSRPHCPEPSAHARRARPRAMANPPNASNHHWPRALEPNPESAATALDSATRHRVPTSSEAHAAPSSRPSSPRSSPDLGAASGRGPAPSALAPSP
eukprot:9477007-Pyramimonas_sp.AAC.1